VVVEPEPLPTTIVRLAGPSAVSEAEVSDELPEEAPGESVGEVGGTEPPGSVPEL
jgi:hypothetical protein